MPKEQEKLDEEFKADHVDGVNGNAKTQNGDGVKKTPKRRGDKDGGEKTADKVEPKGSLKATAKTKAGLTNEVLENLKEMSQEDVAKVLAFMEGKDKDMEDDESEDGEDEKSEKKESAKSKKVTKEDVDASEALDKIFEGHELSDSFMKEAKVVFETILVEKINKFLSDIVIDEDNLRKEALEEAEANLEKYLDHVADEYVKEHQETIDHNLQVQLNESFMTGLQELFEKHYIHVPEDKLDVVKDLSERLEATENSLNKAITETISLTEEVEEFKRKEILVEASEGLTALDYEKLKELTENVIFDYADIEGFKEKVQIIKDKHFADKKETVSEAKSSSDTGDVITEETKGDPYIDMIADSISKHAAR